MPIRSICPTIFTVVTNRQPPTDFTVYLAGYEGIAEEDDGNDENDVREYLGENGAANGDNDFFCQAC